MRVYLAFCLALSIACDTFITAATTTTISIVMMIIVIVVKTEYSIKQLILCATGNG